MKLKIQQTIIVCLVLVFASFEALAESPKSWPKKGVNIGWVYTKLNQTRHLDINSSIGVNLNTARTYYVTRPIANFLRIGLDVVWVDLTYSMYKVKFLKEPKIYDESLLDAAISMQAGVSFVMQPANHFTIIPYVRYAPAFHIFHDGDDTGTMFSAFGILGGVRIAYRFIGIGLDYHVAKGDASPFFRSFYPDMADGKLSTKTNELRAYVTFNF